MRSDPIRFDPITNITVHQVLDNRGVLRCVLGRGVRRPNAFRRGMTKADRQLIASHDGNQMTPRCEGDRHRQ